MWATLLRAAHIHARRHAWVLSAAHDVSHTCCRALVDAPDATRKIVNFKRLALTDFKVDITRQASKKVLIAKLAESGELKRVISGAEAAHA